MAAVNMRLLLLIAIRIIVKQRQRQRRRNQVTCRGRRKQILGSSNIQTKKRPWQS